MGIVSNVISELVMPTPFKMKHVAVIAASLRRRKLALSGAFALLAAVLLAPAALTTSAWQIFGSPSAKDGAARTAPPRKPAHSALPNPAAHASALHLSSWAGGLEPARPEEQSSRQAQAERPITSASYTSGFDNKAEGLGPLPRAQSSARLIQARDPRACPSDLNCSFRSMKPVAAVAPPQHRPAGPVVPEPVKSTTPESNGFSLFAAHLRLPSPHLPSANSLLQPFTFVSTTVVHFVKKM